MTRWQKLINISLKKKIFILTSLFVLFSITDFLSFKLNPHTSFFVIFIKKLNFETSLKKTKNFYKDTYKKPIETDEFILLTWLYPTIAQRNLKTYEIDPFYRLLNKDYKINITNKEDIETFAYLMTDWTDADIIPTLYCDKIDYSQDEFEQLKKIRDYKGYYGDTHYLMSLLFLESLNCQLPEILTKEKSSVINAIIKAQNNTIQPSIDLFAERIVFLYWAGEKKQIKYNWIKRLVHSQNNDGSWTEIGTQESDYHITGLSALAIQYYINNGIDNNIWFILENSSK